MKQRKEVLRTCIITKEKLPKKELLRIVRTPEGNIEVDLTGANKKYYRRKISRGDLYDECIRIC